jgi:hypothetical protein
MGVQQWWTDDLHWKIEKLGKYPATTTLLQEECHLQSPGTEPKSSAII